MAGSSLQRQLNVGIGLAALLFFVLSAALTGTITFLEAQELQDDMLQEIASLATTDRLGQASIVAAQAGSEHEEESVFILAIDPAQPQDDSPWQTKITADGFHTVNIGDEEWRLLVTTRPGQRLRVVVGQQTELRDAIALGMAMNVILPMAVLIVILMYVIHRVIANYFKPLEVLTRQLDKQHGSQLALISEQGVPTEISPFVVAINGQLSRIKVEMARQRRFVADAAHELRTPLTALSLLVENVRAAKTEEETGQRLALLQHAMERMRLLVVQLLDLARLQEQKQLAADEIAFDQVIQRVVADLYLTAEASGIELIVGRFEPLLVSGQQERLAQLVRNAIDNAVRYSQPGSEVQITLQRKNNDALFAVNDKGPGISAEDLAHITEPFYRGTEHNKPGTGLGLAICSEIALSLGGRLTLANRNPSGFSFQYAQPLIVDEQKSA